jgi:hypothetical protein
VPAGRWAALVALGAMACSTSSAQDVPKGEAAFTEYVAAQMRREMTGPEVVVKGPLTLAVGETQANLDRIYLCCGKNSAGCPREVSTYVKGIAQIERDRLTPPSKDAVRVLVRTQEYAAAYQAALPKDARLLQPRVLAGGFVMLPAIDEPRSFRVLTEEDNTSLGLSTDEIFELGLANLRTRLKPLLEVAKTAQRGQIGHLSGDAYHPSRLVLHESWAPLAKAQGGTLIVAAPATGTVLYVGEDTAIAIDALTTLTKNVWSRTPNQLSTELLRWTPKGWELVR